MTRLLPNPAFLPWLLRAIARARCSIILVNYLAVLEEDCPPREQARLRRGRGDRHGPVRRVADALVAAQRRGVAVEVVLEGSKFRENYAFYRALKDAGVDVWMDTSLTFIHTKAVLIDDRILCVGSHNLSASALASHHELSIATGDRAAIKRFRAELARMTSQKRGIAASVCRDGTRLPISIILPPLCKPASRGARGGGRAGWGRSPPLTVIKRSASPHAYLLYLLLCRLDGGRPRAIPVDAADWADELSLPKSVASARVRIDAILEFMDRKLGVVKHDRQKNTILRLAPCALRPTPSSILIPSTFWKYGWHRSLTVEAIHLYLAGEAETTASPFAPWWRQKRDEVAARYGFQKQLVNRAQVELRRVGLLEVIFETGMAPAGRFARQMNYFRENPFYDRAALEKQMRWLSGRYPSRVSRVASCILTAICEDSDVEKMAAVCDLVRKRGPAAAGRALAALRRLSPNSTRRQFGYVQELLEGGSLSRPRGQQTPLDDKQLKS